MKYEQALSTRELSKQLGVDHRIITRLVEEGHLRRNVRRTVDGYHGRKFDGEEEMEVRATIQQIVLEHRRRYGYRRVTAELRRRGLLVNHKRVARLMREDNLLDVCSPCGSPSTLP